MRPLDPLLIGSFPAPPTHIPQTPTSPNPPLSRPPSTPLPPIPRLRRQHESISSIDMGDILATSDDEDDDILFSLPPLSRTFAFPPRPSSPDIATIISATPRPRAHSLHKSKSRPSIRRRASDGPYNMYHHSPEASDDDDTRSWIDHDEYGKPLPTEEDIRFAKLERQLEASDSEGSDSSLDLHTPLPHLMMRHGLLSPRSKLINTGRDSVASIGAFPLHLFSPLSLHPASTTTTHPLKDTRDTVKRRVRHRDGRLLKGGIGLTTGLGWSDSEDEDAPSALTRRISSLNLTRSTSSLSLSRSASSLSTSSLSHRTRASLPSSRSSTATTSRSISSRTSTSRHPLARSTSTPLASQYTLEALSVYSSNSSSNSNSGSAGPRTPIIAYSSSPSSHSSRPHPHSIPEHDEYDSDSFAGAGDTFHSSSKHPPMDLSELGVNAHLKREKSLPPLPRSSSIPSTPNALSKSLAGMGRSSTSSTATRSSSGSMLAPPSKSNPNGSNPRTTPDPPGMRTPRPLRLVSPPPPGGMGVPYNPSSSTSRPGTTTTQTHLPAPLLLAQRQNLQRQRPVPVPSLSAHSLAPSPSMTPSSRSLSPFPPSSPLPRTPLTPRTPSSYGAPSPSFGSSAGSSGGNAAPGTGERKPRTGTGMVYRSSGQGSINRMTLKVPSASPASLGVGGRVGGVGRGVQGKPIPL
ncbi:hypothetical protein C0991_007765 [Blastosporella zonata]|nr:hypothetical protein C0991_007765 [Blastosporella zonata]